MRRAARIRRIRAGLALLVASTALALAANAHAVTVVDDAGHAFVLERPPRRVVTLAPSLTELVFAAGAARRSSARRR